MEKKYKCITSNRGSLTLNKVYECKKQTPLYIFVVNDRGNLVPYLKSLFEEVK